MSLLHQLSLLSLNSWSVSIGSLHVPTDRAMHELGLGFEFYDI